MKTNLEYPEPVTSLTGKPSRWPRYLRWVSWAAVALLAVLGSVVWLQQRPATPASAGAGGAGRFGAANRVQPVSVAVVQQRDVRVTVVAIGSIAAANTAVVRARVDGELKVLHFKEGQTVRAGQLLAEIDPQPFQIALTLAQGTLARDQALLRNAQLDLQRYRELLARDAAPRQQAETQEALVQQLQGTVLSDQAGVDNAKLQLSYTRVVAPISGLAGLKQADLGNIVHAADANGLLSITQTQPVNVVFAVPDANLPRIRQQFKAGKALPVEAWDRDQKALLAQGRVASTDNAIDSTTGTIRIKAMFANIDNNLFPNQFVNVRLQLDTLVDALVVPSAAVQRGAPGTFVYVATSDGVVSLRRIKTGSVDGDVTSVEGDLKPGEKVVIDGADRLREGAKVEVIAATHRSPAPANPGSAARPARDPAARQSAAPAAASVPPYAPAATTPAGAQTERPRWMDHVPPEMVDKLKAMSPEERRAWFGQHRSGSN